MPPNPWLAAVREEEGVSVYPSALYEGWALEVHLSPRRYILTGPNGEALPIAADNPYANLYTALDIAEVRLDIEMLWKR